MADGPVVFIVDDDDAVRDSLQALLESHGIAAETFPSGAALLSRRPAPDAGCVVSDIRMPGMDGVELIQALTAKAIDLPVIVMTGHGDVPLAVRAMKAGAADFIEKPFDDMLIVEAVRRAMAEAARSADGQTEQTTIRDRIAGLTPRERDVLEHLVTGRANKMIAFELGISPRTVEIHRAHLMAKMQAQNLSHLVRMAVAAGIVGVTS